MSKLTPLLEETKYTILGSISQMNRLESEENLIVYNWDCYSWEDYGNAYHTKFRKLMEKAVDVWHCSETAKRTCKEFYGVDKGIVIKNGYPFDQYPGPIKDDGFVLIPMRHYKKDKQFEWGLKACRDLNLEVYHPDHKFTQGEFSNLIRGCSLILSPYYEASTGGMGILEGSHLGKPVLASKSPYNGAQDFLGDNATYFTDYEDLKDKLGEMMGEKIKTNIDLSEYTSEYTMQAFADRINKRIYEITHSNIKTNR